MSARTENINRRLGERRRFNYTGCIPERRSGHERREIQKSTKVEVLYLTTAARLRAANE